MCGPACPVEPNYDGPSKPHHHPVCRRTYNGGFPVHKIPQSSLVSSAPEEMSKAHLAVQRDQLRRREAQSVRSQLSATTLSSLADVKEHWKISRLFPQVDNAIGLDGLFARGKSMESDIELVELPRRHSDAYLQRDAYVVDPATTILRAGYIADATALRQVASAENVRAQQRHPVVHGTILARAVSDGGVGPGVKHLDLTSRVQNAEANRSRGNTRMRSFSGPRSLDYSARPSRVSPPSSMRRYRSFSPTHDLLQGNCGRAPSRASMQHGQRLRVVNISPRSSISFSIPEEEASNPDESFTLRHIQRMALAKVQPRLEAINAGCKRFKTISEYEAIDAGIFALPENLQELKTNLDQDNARCGGSEADEAAWENFLQMLGNGEKAIEKENARLRMATEVFSMEQLSDKLDVDGGYDAEGRLDSPQDEIKGGAESFATGKEAPAIRSSSP